MNRVAGLAQRAARVVRPAAQNVRAGAKRNMSADAHDPNDMTWRNVSVAGLGFVMALGAYQYKIHLEHLAHGPFDRDYNNFAFHKNRKKDFPWTCSDCALFDSKCWEQCRAPN